MFAFRYGLKKYKRDGDMIGCYFIWYGVVRAILEPLRHKKFQMGTNLTSVWMSIAFVVIGIAIIVLCHVFDKKIAKHYEVELEKYNASRIVNPNLKEKEEIEEVKESDNEKNE